MDDLARRRSASAFEHTLEAARGGDGRAFAALYESLSRRVLAFAEVRGAVDPEGTVNDVFVKVFTHLSDFQGNEAQFAAWVFRIARNDLIDEARRRGRRPVETDLDPTGAETVPGGDTEVEALDRLGDDWVVDQLAALTPEQRDVVALRIVGDLRVEDVADVMDKRVGAIKALQRRAFRTLARNLESGAYPDARSGRSSG